MAWSDIPTVLKNVLNYFGEGKHERRVMRKFIGCWDAIRDDVKVTKKINKAYLRKMDVLRKELR